MSNRIRFSGLASGMDTESIVNQLMQVKRAKVDRYSQDKTRIEWKRDAYHTVNKDIGNFILNSRKNLGLTDYTYLGKLQPKSIERVDWAKKVTSNNENVFTASATGKAPSGSLSVEVKQLAMGATIKGDNAAVSGEDKLTGDINLKIKVGDETKEIALTKGMTYSSAISKIGREAGLNATFGKVGQTDDGTGTGSLRDVYMFSLSTKDTGSNQTISFEDSATQDFFTNNFGATAISAKGKNSQIYIDGNTTLVENSSNNIDINGVNLTLTGLGKATASVTTDVNGIYDKIKEFVDGYNKVIGDLQDKMQEKTYRSYAPLTSEQKEAMKDEDIKLWEEKAKSGILSRESSISTMLQNVRSGLYEDVQGASALYKIGIDTGNYKEGAKLNIDEKKLKAAIAEDPELVLNTLFKSSDDISDYKIRSGDSADEIAKKREGAKNQRAQTGVFVRIMDDMADGMNTFVQQAGAGNESSLLKDVRGNILAGIVTGESTLEYNLSSIEKRIQEENNRLSIYEENLWRQFSAMEKAIQTMRDQSGWLMQQGIQ